MNACDPLKKNNVLVTGNRASKKSLVFVHGFGTDQTAWQAVAASFLHDFQIVFLDNVGAGNSAPDAFMEHRYLNLNAYADDLLDVCAALDLKDAILVGHSVGAMICVLAAIKLPRLFSKLVLIGASPRYLDDAGYRGGFNQGDLDALYRAVTLQYSDWANSFAPMAMGNPDQPRLTRCFADTLKSIPPAHALTVLCSIFQSDHRADLAKLDQPTLLIQSQEDVAVPVEVAHFLNAQIRNSQLSIIAATGHLPHVSAPDAVTAAMQPFVAG